MHKIVQEAIKKQKWLLEKEATFVF